MQTPVYASWSELAIVILSFTLLTTLTITVIIWLGDRKKVSSQQSEINLLLRMVKQVVTQSAQATKSAQASSEKIPVLTAEQVERRMEPLPNKIGVEVGKVINDIHETRTASGIHKDSIHD